MIKKFSQLTEQTAYQTKLWSYAAWTLPFVALAIIVIGYYLNLDSLIEHIMLTISVTFIGTSVFWWWWAINKIVLIMRAMEQTDSNFVEIKEDLKFTREAVRQLSDSNREWGKQEKPKLKQVQRNKNRL